MVCKHAEINIICFLRAASLNRITHNVFPLIRKTSYFFYILKMEQQIGDHPATKRTLLLLLREKSSFKT